MSRIENYVVSYTNPDTDGIACSIALAKLFTAIEEKTYVPVLLGTLSNETNYVLNHIGVECQRYTKSLENASSIILVDTHHKAQLPVDFPFDKVKLVIDHHPNGDSDIFPNAKIDNRRIGAAASIVAEMYFDKSIMCQEMLVLLGMAILSNTLNFSAPSTTDFDKKYFDKIAELYPISDEFVEGMFYQRSIILQEGINASLLSDFKKFQISQDYVGISQLEIYDLLKYIDIVEVVYELKKIAKEKGVKYCMFNGVDLKTQKSIVVCADDNSSELANKIFDGVFKNNYAIFDRILLRKTDFIPLLNK